MKLTLPIALRRWHELMSTQAVPGSYNREIDTIRRYLLYCGKWRDVYAYDHPKQECNEAGL